MQVVDNRLSRMKWAGYWSIGAGVIHSAAIGLHAEHPSAARIFLALTVAQVCWGLVVINRIANPTRQLIMAGVVINVVAVAGWVVTRFVGISFIDGFENAEKPQLADSLCAVLAALCVVAIISANNRREISVDRHSHLKAMYLSGLLSLVALWSLSGNVHQHGHQELALIDSGLTVTADGVIVSSSTSIAAVVTESEQSTTSLSTTKSTQITLSTVATTTTVSTSTTGLKKSGGPSTTTFLTPPTPSQNAVTTLGWPRPFDPAKVLDISGVAGVSSEQEARATALIQSTIRDLPKYASTATALAEQYNSIGDASSGFEHFVKSSLINDGRVLDSTAPESLVYAVSGSTRTLVAAMYMAAEGTPINDETLVNYAGRLMQWHVHNNLCWLRINNVPKVVGVTNAAGVCLFGALQINGSPMVHVWIAPHICGPFAALEGIGAGSASVSDSERVDLCNKTH